MMSNGKDDREKARQEKSKHIEKLRGHEAELKRVKTEVEQAAQTMREAHTGADLAEAKKLLRQVAEAINKGDTTEAISLAQKAQLAAKPTTEYLLSKAKSLEAQGTERYRQDDFSRAIEAWQQSLKEYDRAKELAVKRREDEVVRALAATMATIEKDVGIAQKNKANAEMQAIVKEAQQTAEKAKAQFGSGQFEDAKRGYESARELCQKGAVIACEFGFDDKSTIEEAVAEMGVSIEACMLAKGEAMIETASQEKVDRREEAFLQTLSYLDSFSSTDKPYELLKARAYQGLAAARIQAGMRIMDDAGHLVNQNKFYDAKEAFRKALQHFDNVRDFTVQQRLEAEKAMVDDLIQKCTSKVEEITGILINRQQVAVPKEERVGGLGPGPRYEAKQRIEIPGQSMVNKLEKVYGPVRFLGSGGFGEVYSAQRRSQDGNVIVIALKVPREPEKNQSMFFKELDIWKRLDHPNIVRLIQPLFSPVPLFEMEYVDGGDLRGLMDRSPALDPMKACTIAFDVARALEYAHDLGVIHTDLKPRNVLMTKLGEPKVTDWGLGKVATSSISVTGYTPGYAAPEQMQKGKGIVSKSTDVYQLGLLTYEMMTGSNPFDFGSLADKDERVPDLVPEKPSRYNPKIEPLDDLILGCLQRDSKSRPSIRQFREQLAKYIWDAYSAKLNDSKKALLDAKEQWNMRSVFCEMLMLSAKNGDHQKCVHTLGQLMSLVANADLRDKILSLRLDMEHRHKEKLVITDEVIDDLNGMVWTVRHGQS